MTVQTDDAFLEKFKEACEAIGVSAIDYIEIKINEIIKNYMNDVASAPGIDNPRCHIVLGDV